MPAVDLSQLPEPAIIAEPDFEAILADTKAMMIAAYPAEQREVVSAALELESEPLNVIAQTMSFREMLLRQRVNEGARACMLSHSAGTDLDNLAGNMNTKRLVITPATDTTDAVMESDTSLRLRAQRAYDGLSVAGPSGAYEYFARSASGLVRDARAISPSPANVTVSILSTEGDGTATEALLNTVRSVLNAEDTRPVADRLTVQSARIVTWRLNAKLYFYPGPESEPILAAAESSFRKWLAEQGLIGQDVALSAIAATLHVHGVQRVEISQFHPTDVSPLTVLPVCRSANALTFLALIEISLEPSKPTPAIFRAVFSFVAVAALPDSSPERPPLNVCRLVQVFAVLSNGIFSPLVPSSRKPRF